MSTTIDQQFVEYVVKYLVSNPEAVKVDRSVDEKGVLLELTVDPEDLGRVIGKRGATAQSLRTLLRALGTKNEARYNLKIVDNGEPRPARNSSDDNDQPSDDSSFASDDTSDYSNDSDESSEPESSSDSDRVSKTRQELADLDDLDV